MKKINLHYHPLRFNKKAVLSKINKSEVALQAILVGVIAGILVSLFRVCIEGVASFIHESTYDLPRWQYIIALPTIGALGGLIAGLLIFKIAPETTGSGIPYVKLTLARIGKGVRLRSILVKFFAGVAGIGAGLSLGREGPSVQLGSGAGSLVAKLFKVTGTYRDKLIAAGSGAAIGATFNAPIAATIFVLEELIHVFSSTFLFTVLIATTTAATLVRHFFGNNPSFNIPELNNFIHLSTIPVFVFLGIIAGILGVAFSKNVLFSIDIFNKFKTVPGWVKTTIAGFVAGTIGIFLPSILGPGNLAIEDLLHGKISAVLIFIILIGKFFLTPFCFASGAAGGLFLPTLMIGAFLGYLTGFVFNTYIGFDLNLATMALVGMGAFLSAVVRTPLTAVVIVFELTGSYQNILPIMFSVAIADLVAERFSSLPIYSSLIFKQKVFDKKSLFLSEHKVKEKMIRRVESLQNDTTLSESLEFIKSTLHCGFPVVNKNQELLGIVTKSAIEDAIIQGTSLSSKITEMMNPNPTIIHEKDTLYNALFELHLSNTGWLIVIDDENKVKGIITRFDIKNAVSAHLKQKENKSITLSEAGT